MSHRGRHMHGGFGIFMFVAAIAFAFGPRVARIVVGAGLIVSLAFFAYVLARIVMGTI